MYIVVWILGLRSQRCQKFMKIFTYITVKRLTHFLKIIAFWNFYSSFSSKISSSSEPSVPQIVTVFGNRVFKAIKLKWSQYDCYLYTWLVLYETRRYGHTRRYQDIREITYIRDISGGKVMWGHSKRASVCKPRREASKKKKTQKTYWPFALRKK